MRNISNKVALKPQSTVYDQATDTIVHIPFHGGGAAAVNLSGTLPIKRGATTKITLGSTPSPLPMPGTMVKLNSVTPADYNGYHRVLASTGANVWIDLDSSEMADWTSGGNMSFNHIYDKFGNMAPADIAGTITGLWVAPQNGMTSHSGGSYTGLLTAGIDPFDLTGFRGILVVGCNMTIPVAPNAAEQVFGMGVFVASGTNTAEGAFGVTIESGGTTVGAYFRPATAADSAGSNKSGNTGSLGTTTKRHVAWVLDFRDFPNTSSMYTYLDGVLKDTDALTLTNAIDLPSNANGVCIGGRINTDLSIINKLGSAATPSQATVENFVFWKSTKTMAETQAALVQMIANGGVPGSRMI